MGRDISRLTGGRYRRVTIDDHTLDIGVWSPERGDWVAASALSKGTIDQIFLAARIGLVRLVTQGRRPPLILDDPFVSFDDARAARAALLLRELSSDFQVIYLACSNRYDGLADLVAELPGPVEPESAADGSTALRTTSMGAAVAAESATPVAQPAAAPSAPAPRGRASARRDEARKTAEDVAAADEAGTEDEIDGPILFTQDDGTVGGGSADGDAADDQAAEASDVESAKSAAGPDAAEDEPDEA